MADQFPSTLLPQDNTPEQIQKANLDLLKKINTTAQGSADIINQIKSNQYQPQWQPYPAGAYVFPSGTQTVLAGVLPIGAITTAPTFGTGTTSQAWFRYNGKTIDVMWQILQPTLTLAAAGSGVYLVPMPLGKLMDTNFVVLGSTAAGTIGSSFQGMALRAVIAAVTYICSTNAIPISQSYFQIVGNYSSSSGTANVIQWGSVGFNPNACTTLSFTGIITGIPIQ